MVRKLENWKSWFFENKVADFKCFDLRGVSDLVDYSVVVIVNNARQMKYLVEEVMIYAKSVGEKLLMVDGIGSQTWVALDFGDLVIHLFLPESYEKYDLEALWGDKVICEI